MHEGDHHSRSVGFLLRRIQNRDRDFLVTTRYLSWDEACNRHCGGGCSILSFGHCTEARFPSANYPQGRQGARQR